METIFLVSSLILLSFISRAADAIVVRSSDDNISEGKDHWTISCVTV